MKKGWELARLDTVIINFIVPQRDRPKVFDGDVPWCRIEDFDGIYLSKSKSGLCVSEALIESMPLRVYPADTVIVSCSADLGRCAIIARPLITNQTFIGLVPSENIKPLYLYYLMGHKADHLNAIASGAIIKYLSKKKFQELEIPIPPLSEQEEIVEVLDTAFAAIDQAKANIEQNIANANELFQSKLNQIFSQKGEGWVETTLGNLIKVKHGFAFKSQFFTTEGEHVLLTPGNYHEKGGYRDRGSKQKYYVGEIPEGYILEQDDLLLAMTEQAAGLLGSPLLVPESNRFLHNQRLGLIQHISDQPPSNRYLFHAFNTKSFRDEIHNTGTGVKVRHTSPTKICEVTINITFDTEMQKQVVNTLESLQIKTDAIVTEYQTKLASLDELKKSILQKAFAGELT